MIDYLEKNIKKLIKEEKMIFLFTFIFGLLNFFYLLTNHVLSPDGLAYGPIYKSNGWEVDLGRPFLLIVDRLRGGLVTAPVIMFIALFNISLSAIFLKKIYGIHKKIPVIVLTLLLVLFPTLSESALFIYCFDSYSFSLLFSILAIYFIQKDRPILSILFIISSLSLYQAYISVTLTGVLVLEMIKLLNSQFNFKKFIRNFFLVFMGLVSYFILLKGGMFLFGRSMANYKGASSFGIDTILSLPKSIMHAYFDYFSYFFSETIIFNQYYFRNIIHVFLFILFFISLIQPFKKMNWTNRFLFLFFLIVFPISTNIMDLIACDTTINLVTGIGFIMTYILVISSIDYFHYSFMKYISYTLLIVLSYTFLLSNNGTFMSREDTWRNHYYESISLLNKAKALDDYQEDLNWMFSDVIRYQSKLVPTSNGYLSKDYETYDNYFGILEIEIFFDHYFGERISIIDYDTYQEIGRSDEFKNMKLGDVKIINSVVVCKISNELAF